MGFAIVWQCGAELPVQVTGNLAVQHSCVPLLNLSCANASIAGDTVFLKDSWLSDCYSCCTVIVDELSSPSILFIIQSALIIGKF